MPERTDQPAGQHSPAQHPAAPLSPAARAAIARLERALHPAVTA